MHELPLTLRNTAAAEHFVLSNVKKAIPTSVQDKWHEYRAALKQAELENLGDNEVSRDMEMAGWGVKEAEEANQTEASKSDMITFRAGASSGLTDTAQVLLRSSRWHTPSTRASSSYECPLQLQ